MPWFVAAGVAVIVVATGVTIVAVVVVSVAAGVAVVVVATGVTIVSAAVVVVVVSVAAGVVVVATGVTIVLVVVVAAVVPPATAPTPRVAVPLVPLAVTAPQPTTALFCCGSVTVRNQLFGNVFSPCGLLSVTLPLTMLWPLVVAAFWKTEVPVQLSATILTLIC